MRRFVAIAATALVCLLLSGGVYAGKYLSQGVVKKIGDNYAAYQQILPFKTNGVKTVYFDDKTVFRLHYKTGEKPEDYKYKRVAAKEMKVGDYIIPDKYRLVDGKYYVGKILIERAVRPRKYN